MYNFNFQPKRIVFVILLVSCFFTYAQENSVFNITKAENDASQKIIEDINYEKLSDTEFVIKGTPNETESDKFTLEVTKIISDNQEIYSSKISNLNSLIDQTRSNYDSSNNSASFKISGASDLNEILKSKGARIYYTIKYTGGASYGLLDANKTYSSSFDINPVEKVVVRKNFSPLEIMEAAITYVDNNYSNKYHDKKRNLYLKDNIVHIFIDENGNLIKTGLPTTATKKYLYQLHLLVEQGNINKAQYKFQIDGEFKPTFNINDTSNTEGNSLVKEDGAKNKPKIIDITYSVNGPYTDKFDIKLYKYENAKEVEKLLDHEVKIAKSYQVSISTGLFSSTLKNPENIQKIALASGDSTLVADNPNSRGAITLMATFYPRERSFLFPPDRNTPFMDRIGIQVGTQVNDKLTENFFLGLSYDITWGSSISAGVHYGRRNYIAGKEDFDFGTEIFDLPELVIKKEWQAGFYFGVVIDTRVAFKLISSLAGSND
ncbi:hypothetical protein [Pseudotenacibaculum haliotis]|uniref:Uncharacterized protein n=1 Tax=Pseudotenacibaculum haliotis TaxID=1862138 RepID=A0ABW5LRL2_9FLAO